jgi:hypothetical protein
MWAPGMRPARVPLGLGPWGSGSWLLLVTLPTGGWCLVAVSRGVTRSFAEPVRVLVVDARVPEVLFEAVDALVQKPERDVVTAQRKTECGALVQARLTPLCDRCAHAWDCCLNGLHPVGLGSVIPTPARLQESVGEAVVGCAAPGRSLLRGPVGWSGGSCLALAAVSPAPVRAGSSRIEATEALGRGARAHSWTDELRS